MNKLSKYIFVIFSVISVMTIGGCIKNDIPYPVEKMYITSLTAEGVIGKPRQLAAVRQLHGSVRTGKGQKPLGQLPERR